MIEAIKHALGLCGEGHPNIFMIAGLTLTPVIIGGKHLLNKLKTKNGE